MPPPEPLRLSHSCLLTQFTQARAPPADLGRTINFKIGKDDFSGLVDGCGEWGGQQGRREGGQGAPCTALHPETAALNYRGRQGARDAAAAGAAATTNTYFQLVSPPCPSPADTTNNTAWIWWTVWFEFFLLVLLSVAECCRVQGLYLTKQLFLVSVARRLAHNVHAQRFVQARRA